MSDLISWKWRLHPHHQTLPAVLLCGTLQLFDTHAAQAHALGVFVTLDCTSIDVDARYSDGKQARVGKISLFDDRDILVVERPVSPNTATRIPFEAANMLRGFRVVVDTGSHDDYWIVTPDDLSESCAQQARGVVAGEEK